MNIVVIGAGGVGGHFGALLQRAGHEVTFQARGTHLSAMRAGGLRIRTLTESFVLPVRAVPDASGEEGIELVMLAVKSYSLRDVAPSVRALAERGAMVLPLLNGIDIVQRCAALGVPQGALVGGIARISVVKAGDGEIYQDDPQQAWEAAR
jgi:2-dehydropantoate 2-reductase